MSKPTFLIAPNGLKGSLLATEACDIIATAIEKAIAGVTIIKQPIADGGQQTTEIITKALKGKLKKVTVKDPLNRDVEAQYGLLDNGKTGVMELSAASGHHLLNREELNPMRASTFGTGQLMQKLLDEGCTRIIIGVGGSATVDGGTGMLKALGARLTERNKSAIPLGGGYLHTIVNIDLTELDSRLADCEIEVLCDVENKLLGREGAAMVFGPQKGATIEQVRLLEENMEHFAKVTKRLYGVDMADMVHGGAAGGTAAALAAYTNAKLVPGIAHLMEVVHMEDKVKEADIVITAEGRLDEQTLKGKGPYGLAKLAKKHGKAVVCITGQLAENLKPKDFELFDAIITLPTRPMTLDESIKETKQLLKLEAGQLAQVLRIGLEAGK